MYLAFDLLARIFPLSSGIKDTDLLFQTVSDQGGVLQPRGLFIPLWGNSQQLFEAINNGAIAAIWEQEQPIPAYTPNHFPLFITNKLGQDVIRLMDGYCQILKQEDEREAMSNFLFINDQLLNEKLKTYDKAKLYSDMLPLAQTLMDLRRG